ncbi:Uma2 family endonuclease [soil metagenome]
MALPHAGTAGWTAADLASVPDDGNRYELMQGVLLVSPMPRSVHQRANHRLVAVLNAAAPAGVEAYLPLDWQISEVELYAPDVMLVRNEDLTDRVLRVPPILAAEVLSPSSRRLDQVAKRAAYADAGAEHYWLVDPDEPSVVALRLGHGAYVQVASTRGDDLFDVEDPIAVVFTPSSLVQPR